MPGTISSTAAAGIGRPGRARDTTKARTPTMAMTAAMMTTFLASSIYCCQFVDPAISTQECFLYVAIYFFPPFAFGVVYMDALAARCVATRSTTPAHCIAAP